MSLADSLQTTLKTIPSDVRLIAVSKTHSAKEIEEMYHCGQIDFGENKVQELIEKYDQLPKSVRWHQIGHLQRNKVKYIAPFIYLIHSVDSIELLETIEKEALKNNRTLSVLLQIKIAQEESKYGLTFDSALEILKLKKDGKFPHVSINGLMGMASFTDNINQVEKEFSSLHDFYITHQKEYGLTVLSMGMSDDYLTAIKCGSTMVRIGSKLFGKRNYTV
ncbi:MAG: YggS family pyridoxal phosphate-dependent enzyme [Apibacter sp.]|jgi:PLP dependent protein|nr:YggS family pyridoxal phosphate-dependent enzyme [Apibacter sp.]